MQTNQWMPAPAIATPRPSWLHVIGWYFAGCGATGTAWTMVVAVSELTSRTVGSLFAQGLLIASIVALVRYGGALPRRSRTALVLGAITPFVLMALFIVLLIWAIANSNWQF